MTALAASAPRIWAPRLIPAFETDAGVIAFARSRVGRGLLLAFMLALSVGSLVQLVAVAFAAVVAFLPRRRALTLPLATIVVAALASGGGEDLAAVILVFAASGATIALAARVGRRGPFARPVLSLLLLVLGLAAVGSLPGLPVEVKGAVWTAAIALTGVKWFLAHAIVNVTGQKPLPMSRHLATLHPFWGSTTTPFGKGAAFIAKFEAKTPEALAVSQLKGAKLLVWASLLQVTSVLFHQVVQGYLAVPSLHAAIAAHAAGQSPGRLVALASLPTHFVTELLALAVMGHTYIAIARFAGFCLPRNTVSPLRAQSIADFWNRYYYYFKELLVDFFFMPTFARLNTWPPRARILAATFCAAGLGNYLFHFTRDIDLIRVLGPRTAILGSANYAFYCCLLALGIGCSQLLSSGSRRPAPPRRMAGLGTAGALLFFCVLSIFDDESRLLSLGDHMDFLFYILGIES